MDKSYQRRTSYKTPPSVVSDPRLSQQARRTQALEEQKRKRLQRVDSARQLDLFADLSLGQSDEEEDEPDQEPVRAGVAQFVPLLGPGPTEPLSTAQGGQVKKPRAKRKGRKKKPNKWADKCMYAELLEMAEDAPWADDGLPQDLESGWVALTPVPVGKRCLAITQQAPGVLGVAHNTTLRSRLLGKAILAPFPSPLPPSTILDCILDRNWKENGILHVLDVVRWKGQDIGDCEAGFRYSFHLPVVFCDNLTGNTRFWWRDTRLSELTPFPPPYQFKPRLNDDAHYKYQFPYPTTLVPVPYTTPTPYAVLLTTIIPGARTPRTVRAMVPSAQPDDAMQLDGRMGLAVHEVDAEIAPDGLLLYVTRASYEPGTSPLSSWVPILAYTDDYELGESNVGAQPVNGPLAIFERLVRKRVEMGEGGMDI